jgi:hypothetical protein
MILKVNHQKTIEISLPVFACFLWMHLAWFLGFAQVALIGIIGASESWDAHTLRLLLVASGLAHALVGYVKANPPPSIVEPARETTR